jgi:hypothetical protein
MGMKKRTRTPAAPKPKPKNLDEFEVVAIPYKMTLTKSAVLLEATLNRAKQQNRRCEKDTEHPAGERLILWPQEKQDPQAPQVLAMGMPPELVALLTGGNPEAFSKGEHQWGTFMHKVLKGLNASGCGNDMKKGIMSVVQTIVKANGFNAEKIREYITLCETHGKTHNCGSSDCALREASELAVEALQAHLKENLQ